MMEPRNVLYFFILICFYGDTVNSNNSVCKICQRRDFAAKSRECTCPPKQFCNETTRNCNNCGECFNIWDDSVKKAKENIVTILENFIKKYETNLDEVVYLIKTLIARTQAREDDTYKLNNNVNDIQKRIDRVSEKIKKLKNDLEKIEELLDLISVPNNVDKILATIIELQKKINEIFKKLKEIKFNINDNLLKQLRMKLKNTSDYIKKVNENFPEIDKNSLSLAFGTESDLDFLESVIRNYDINQADKDNFPTNIEENMKWIENDLIILFDLISNYRNVSVNYENLVKKAMDVRSKADETRTKLTNFLKEQEKFEKLFEDLQKEYKTFEEIQNLQKRINETSIKIRDFNDLLKTIRALRDFNEELKNYSKEMKNLNETLSKIDTNKLDQLLLEEIKQLKAFKNLNEISDLGTVENHTNTMSQEIDKYIRDIQNHCKETKT